MMLGRTINHGLTKVTINNQINIMHTDMTLAQFQVINWRRNLEVFKGEDKDNKYLTIAMIEELGELAGALKKLERGFNVREFQKTKKKILEGLDKNINDLKVPNALLLEQYKDALTWEYETHGNQVKVFWQAKHIEAMSKEAADLFIYLLLFCSQNNIDLMKTTIAKFNQVSIEMDRPEFIIKQP